MILVGGLGWAQQHENKDDIASIRKQIDLFSNLVLEGDEEGIRDCYTEDAKIFPNNQQILEGEDITLYWTTTKDAKIVEHTIRPIEIKINEDWAYDYGTYEGVTAFADGTKSSWKGKYVVVWKKIEEQWKMHLDIWNRIQD